jgi:uncharacterized membrane protein HdeD (DUF308 family)
MAKKSSVSISSPLLYIILGALLVIFKSQMLNWAMTIAGIFCLVMGILDIVKGRVGSGIFNIALGVIILVVGWTILSVVLLVLGVLIAAKGVADLIAVFKRKKKNALSVVFAILTIVIGIALAFGNLLGDLITVIGVLLIIDGILGLVGAKK